MSPSSSAASVNVSQLTLVQLLSYSCGAITPFNNFPWYTLLLKIKNRHFNIVYTRHIWVNTNTRTHTDTCIYHIWWSYHKTSVKQYVHTCSSPLLRSSWWWFCGEWLQTPWLPWLARYLENIDKFDEEIKVTVGRFLILFKDFLKIWFQCVDELSSLYGFWSLSIRFLGHWWAVRSLPYHWKICLLEFYYHTIKQRNNLSVDILENF